MAVAGSLTYSTEIDKSGFEKGLNSLKTSTNTIGGQIKSIVAALGIDKLISATFNLLNNSIDSAISRLDTLNNFPKVMSNLGIASEDSSKAVQKMSDRLSGLPTTLDAGASAVQRFTSANNDVQKSTDYFLALNDALLAGGASTDIQSSALEQLSQMYAVGTVDAQAWRSVLTAMPAQLKQVATYMGYTSTAVGGDLYTALQKGEISMNDFMDALVTLDTEGAEGVQAFEQQARNSTDGIATSITVAKTQVIKGVADIIEKLDQVLKDEGLGGISTIIANIGKKAKEVLDMLANNLPAIVEKIKEFAPLIISIIAGLTAFKTTLLAISAINIVTKIGGLVITFIKLLPAIKSVKDAMLLLNMTFAVNPILLIIAAIATLVAGFIYLWNTSESFRNFWIELWNNIKEIFEPIVNSIINFFTNTIPNAIQSFINFFSNFPYNVGYLIGQAIVWFVTLPQRIKQHFDESKQKMQEWISNMLTMVRNKIPEIINSIRNFFAELPNNMLNIGKNIVEGLWNGIVNAKDWLLGKIGQFTKGIMDGFKNKTTGFDINSPSHKTRDEVGRFIPQGIAVGIEADTDKALKAIDNMNDEIMSEMNRAVAYETGSINATASVKSNNSMLNVIQATFNIDGSVDIDGQKAGRLVAPTVCKTIKAGGLA